jgi:uncharacterized protein (UPF0335 family)
VKNKIIFLKEINSINKISLLNNSMKNFVEDEKKSICQNLIENYQKFSSRIFDEKQIENVQLFKI